MPSRSAARFLLPPHAASACSAAVRSWSLSRAGASRALAAACRTAPRSKAAGRCL